MKDLYFVRTIDYSLKPDDEGYESIQLCGKKDIIKINQTNSDVWYRFIETLERKYNESAITEFIDILRQLKISGQYFKWEDITNLVTLIGFNANRFFLILQCILEEMNGVKAEFDEDDENIVEYINPRKKQGLRFIINHYGFGEIILVQYE